MPMIMLRSWKSSTGSPLMLTIRSPDLSPAFSPGLPASTEPMTGLMTTCSVPTMAMPAMKAMAITMFMNGPAKRIRNRCHFGLERNSSGFPATFSSGESPAMRTYPPSGISETR
jgi:hypothetical protein